MKSVPRRTIYIAGAQGNMDELFVRSSGRIKVKVQISVVVDIVSIGRNRVGNIGRIGANISGAAALAQRRGGSR